MPQWSYLKRFRRKDEKYKDKQKENFDSGHHMKDLPSIPNNTEVWITTESELVSGRVISPAG